MKYTELELNLTACMQGISDFKPLYVLSGDDDYLKSSATDIFKRLTNESFRDMNYSVIDFSRGASEAVDALMTYPMFDAIRVVVFDGVADKLSESDKAAFENYFEHPNDAAILVINTEQGAKCGLENKKYTEVVDCAKLKESEIAKVIDKQLSAPPLRTITEKALKALADRTRCDMARITAEIEKLKAYSDGVIEIEDVEALVAADTEYRIYELSSAVGNRDAKKTLSVLDALAKDGVKPMSIINSLYTHYRKVLHVALNKEMGNAELAKLLETSPGAVHYLREEAASHSQLRLKSRVDYLNAVQFAVMSGKQYEASALHDVVLTLLADG